MTPALIIFCLVVGSVLGFLLADFPARLKKLHIYFQGLRRPHPQTQQVDSFYYPPDDDLPNRYAPNQHPTNNAFNARRATEAQAREFDFVRDIGSGPIITGSSPVSRQLPAPRLTTAFNTSATYLPQVRIVEHVSVVVDSSDHWFNKTLRDADDRLTDLVLLSNLQHGHLVKTHVFSTNELLQHAILNRVRGICDTLSVNLDSWTSYGALSPERAHYCEIRLDTLRQRIRQTIETIGQRQPTWWEVMESLFVKVCKAVTHFVTGHAQQRWLSQ